MRVYISVIIAVLYALTTLSQSHAAVFNVPSGDTRALITAINTANGNKEDNTILLEAGTYTLTAVDNNTDGPNALPSIRARMTIQGTGADNTIITSTNDVPLFRIIHVASSGLLVLDSVTIVGGRTANFNGGGIFNRGMVTLTHSTVSDNFTVSFQGGGGGGGIYNSYGKLNLTDSTVSDNFAVSLQDVGGGGILNNGGDVIILRSTISDNGAASISGLSNGGGIMNFGTMSVSNSTISDNFAESVGAAKNVSGGAGIFNSNELILRNSTITGNVARDVSLGSGVGGGIRGSAALTHTIVAGNSADEPTLADCSGTLTSLGHNLVGARTGCPSYGPGDLTVDPTAVSTTVLRLLQNNGGPTQTHALFPESPAIDAGGSGCLDATGQPLTTDQRGSPRPNGAACDIGAIEVIPADLAPPHCIGTGSTRLQGNVRSADDRPGTPDVTLMLRILSGFRACSDITKTDARGNYMFPDLAAGTYLVTPMKASCTFVPPAQTLPIQVANVEVDFRGICLGPE